MSFLDDFLRPKPPPIIQYANRKEVQEIMKSAGAPQAFAGDKHWELPTDDQVMQIALDSGVRNRTWIPEKYDCDNFAISFLDAFGGTGYCVGVVWAIWKNRPDPYHAVNWYINNERKLIFIDPQDYSEMEPPAVIILMFTN